MEIYYATLFFIFGTILGSFYNVVGYRLPRGESIAFPPSHCTKCGHRLTTLELIPILSFLLQKGKCKNCGDKISWFYTIFEFLTGLMFMLSYLVFGLSIDTLIAITFISMLLIIIISDYQTMIIPDELLIFTGILLIIEILIKSGLNVMLHSLLNAIIMFVIMFAIKKIGDFLFKKESMGGGDIKLMFIYGLVLGWPTSCISICLAAFIGLPVSLILLKKNNSHEIPFGPFLAVAAIILVLTKTDINVLIDLLTIK
ncbi:MAG: prepilin peptidase [Lactobacillales bacterium]|nr:prepilin peptidase [Lactobacillales bacterium]